MYDGKKWILDLVLSLSLRMVVLSVFWFILCRERFEGGLEENLMCYYYTNYYVWKEMEFGSRSFSVSV